MPRPRKSTTKPRRAARKPRARGRRVNSRNVPEYASLSVKRTLVSSEQGGFFAANTLYSLMNTTLDQYPRAVQVAQAYQHYRIKKVALTFKPSYDTYQSANAAVTKPRLYYMIDKAAAIPTNVALEGLKAMGARPKELDEKPFVVQWSPSVLEAAMDVAPGSIASKYRISPWLSTNNAPLSPGAFVPSTVDHLGLYWYLDQLGNPNGQVYTVEVEVQFQFKKPLTNILSSVSAKPALLAAINNSPDGVVGGSDDHLATQ